MRECPSPEALTAVILDMTRRVGSKEFTYHSWPQTWPDTSCGFAEGGGAAMTTTQSHAALYRDGSGEWGLLVYHNNRYAYTIHELNAELWLLSTGDHNLPGRHDIKADSHIPGLGHAKVDS